MRAHRIITLRMLIRNADQLAAHLAECLIEARTAPATEYGRLYSRFAAATHKRRIYREELAMLESPSAAPEPQPVA